jgi:hypothetical protein
LSLADLFSTAEVQEGTVRFKPPLFFFNPCPFDFPSSDRDSRYAPAHPSNGLRIARAVIGPFKELLYFFHITSKQLHMLTMVKAPQTMLFEVFGRPGGFSLQAQKR